MNSTEMDDVQTIASPLLNQYIDSYKKGDLSLGQLCEAMDVSKESGMQILSSVGVDVIDYELSDELSTLESF